MIFVHGYCLEMNYQACCFQSVASLQTSTLNSALSHFSIFDFISLHLTLLLSMTHLRNISHPAAASNTSEAVLANRLQLALAAAAVNAPSVLVWDDLNQIVPALDNDPSNEVSAPSTYPLAFKRG